MINYIYFLVDPKYHKLIKQGATSFSYLIKSETGNNLNVIIVVIL